MNDFILCLKCSPGHRRVVRSTCPHRNGITRPSRSPRLPQVSEDKPFVVPKGSDRLVIADHGRFGRASLPLDEFLAGRKVSGVIKEVHFACKGTEQGDIQLHSKPVDIEFVIDRLLSLDLSQLVAVTLSVPHAGSAPREQAPLQGVTLAQAIHVALVTGLSRNTRVLGLKGSILNGRWASYVYASDLKDMDEWGEKRWRGVESCKMIKTEPIQDINMMFQVLD